jgi:hypothetical protein
LSSNEGRVGVHLSCDSSTCGGPAQPSLYRQPWCSRRPNSVTPALPVELMFVLLAETFHWP